MTEPMLPVGLYEDVLLCLRLSSFHAQTLHNRETAPEQWLDSAITHMAKLGWHTLSRTRHQHDFTPAPRLVQAVFNGALPPAQPPNTRFKALVNAVIRAKADGTKPLPPVPEDNDQGTHLVTEIGASPEGEPRVRLSYLSAKPCADAPKTKLPVVHQQWHGGMPAAVLSSQRERLQTQWKDIVSQHGLLA